jgi:hypothetical protein
LRAHGQDIKRKSKAEKEKQQGELSASDGTRLFVIEQACEAAMAEMTISRPLAELDLRDEFRLQPLAVFSFLPRSVSRPYVASLANSRTGTYRSPKVFSRS